MPSPKQSTGPEHRRSADAHTGDPAADVAGFEGGGVHGYRRPNARHDQARKRSGRDDRDGFQPCLPADATVPVGAGFCALLCLSLCYIARVQSGLVGDIDQELGVHRFNGDVVGPVPGHRLGLPHPPQAHFTTGLEAVADVPVCRQAGSE